MPEPGLESRGEDMTTNSHKKTIKLVEYLDGMRVANSVDDLEAAIQAPFRHAYHGRTWSTICKVRVEAGYRICALHPNGHYVPRFGSRRQFMVCGETYRVGRGQNSTGVRYVWHYADEWARGILMRRGLSRRAAYRILGCWSEYPHRCLSIVEAALAEKIQDPVLNVLIRHERVGYGCPIKYTIQQNDADAGDHRASRQCNCGGTLFDWGAGHSEGFDFINWHCNRCPDVFTEYVTHDRLREIRTSHAALAGGRDNA